MRLIFIMPTAILDFSALQQRLCNREIFFLNNTTLDRGGFLP